MNNYPRIIFIGTTDFSLISLKKLLKYKYFIIGIITSPDKPFGRGQKVIKSSIKKFALTQSIPILQPQNLKDPIFLKTLYKWKADIQIVVSFRILPKEVWSYPTLGTFNLHPSLLPQYRGASPINWVLINGEKETGVTTFLINEKIDSGKILLQKKIPINSEETFGNLYNRLAKIGSHLVIKTLEAIINNSICPSLQSFEGSLKYAPKIFHKDCKINWTHSLNDIFNKIRGLSPYPAAWTLLSSNSGNFSKIFKIYYARTIKCIHNDPIGKIIMTRSCMKISVINGYLSIIDAQLSGKKRMYINDIINGINKYDLLINHIYF